MGSSRRLGGLVVGITGFSMACSASSAAPAIFEDASWAARRSGEAMLLDSGVPCSRWKPSGAADLYLRPIAVSNFTEPPSLGTTMHLVIPHLLAVEVDVVWADGPWDIGIEVENY